VLITQDFHPLCDEHYSEMVTVTIVHLMPSETEITDQACTQPGCTRHFDPITGYYDFTTQGRLQGKFDSPYTCDEHHVKLCVKSHSRPSNTEVWQCPERGCTCIKTVRVAA